jgi:hypothetical protein
MRTALLAAATLLVSGLAHADRVRPIKVPPAPMIRVAQAGPAAQCTVTEIKGTKEKKGLDKKLEKLKTLLSKGPFKLYDTYVLLSEPQVAAAQGKPIEVVLSDKSKVTLLYKEQIAAKGGKARLRFAVDIDNAEGTRVQSTVYAFDAGDPIFIRVDEYPGKTGDGDWAHIDALTCTLP